MKGQLITVIVLMLGVLCYVGDRTGLGLTLFFLGAALEISFWLHAVQAPRRLSSRMLARIGPHR